MKETPTRLGKYMLDPTPLGQGAMGIVYKGYDPDLGHAVAIKIIRRELVDGPDSAPMRQRFKNEAIAGRRLRHPNIVPVYEYGEDKDCSYIVMAFVEGHPLNEVLKDGPRPSLPEALAITRRLLDALQHAHRHHVVHRDIKPANILVGADGEIEIADFGIAKVDLAGLTRTGQVFGTPAYMSPEQCRGTPPSDQRADLFAAGVILYELLTGEQPFRGESALAIMHQVVNRDPEPPSRLNPEVSPALDAVVAKAMAKDREERFQSARAFAQALEEAARPRPAPDIRAMPTLTDTAPTPPLTPPKTPADPPPKAVPESPPKMPPDEGSRKRRRAWSVIAFPVVAIAAVLAFLVVKNDLLSGGDPAPPANSKAVSAPPNTNQRFRTDR
jgi:eukaryotic-like serine/threonine-protein kinase